MEKRPIILLSVLLIFSGLVIALTQTGYLGWFAETNFITNSTSRAIAIENLTDYNYSSEVEWNDPNNIIDGNWGTFGSWGLSFTRRNISLNYSIADYYTFVNWTVGRVLNDSLNADRITRYCYNGSTWINRTSAIVAGLYNVSVHVPSSCVLN